MTQDSTTPLPTETGLDKTFDPAGIEAKWYAHWEQGGLFRPERKDAQPFTIVNPPPNVTGSLHIGHALDNTLQDIVVRYERLRGKDALWVVGTDHAGIATQMVVERQMEARQDKRTNYTREAFIEKVWEWKAESGGTITGQLRRLGCSMDWSREQFTMDPHFTRAVVKVFVDLYNEGLIYRDKRLVNWDPKLKTAISDLEVETKEVQGHFWHFRYPLAADENGNAVTLEDGRDHIVVATTRPETMLADMAVAVNGEDPRYQSVIGKFVKLPITGRLIPIVADDHADPELGSGAVKITPGHDFNDFEVGRRAGIAAGDMLNMFDADANVVQVADGLIPEHFLGLHRFREGGVDGAREAVVAEMKALGLLVLHPGKPDAEGNVPMLEAEARTIATPFGDRGGVVIEPWLTDQWYVNAAELAKAPIEAVKTGAIEIVPKSWEKTYFNWMDNIQPWCVSRQLWWGHQIPAWYGPTWDGKTLSEDQHSLGGLKVFVATTADEALQQARAYYGNDFVVNCSDDPAIPMPAGMTHNSEFSGDALKVVTLHRDSDVLDTWFSSALWPFATLGWPDQTPELVARHYPNDLLISGFDILFFWCARMAMQGMHFMGDVPWKRLYLHGLVRASDGQKMSKSKGNVVDPLGLIDKYGADALRFFMAAMESQGRDVKMDEKRVEGYRNFATKLWNAARFLQSNGVTASTSAAIPQPANDINKWIVGEVIGTVQRIDTAMAALRFDEAALSAYHFVWNRFCDDYIEDIKGGFDAETLETAGWAFDQILVMLHPFMPFITEELWHAMGKRDNELIVARWLDVGSGFTDAYFSAAAKVNWLHELIGKVRSTRADLGVSPSAFVDLVPDSSTGEVSRALLSQYADIIERRARVRMRTTIDIDGARAQIVLGEETFVLPLEGIIDVAAEKARLAKAMAASQKERDSLDKRLSNPAFVEKAKPEAIEKARADHAHHAAEAERLAAALARLG